ncbi:hypothetical protein HZB94_00360 [Candidatus Falkowbacteria bacterium]|nr:hypothetical protein [Candidatus Falkowbacteria bacterium]
MANEVRKVVDGIVVWLTKQGALSDEEVRELYAQGVRFQRIVSEGMKRAQKLSEKMMSAMAASFPPVDLKKEVIDFDLSGLGFKRTEMIEHQFFPFKIDDDGEVIHIAVTNESGFLFLVKKAKEHGVTFKYFSAPLKEIIAAIKKHYPSPLT